jgi:hypothetical protein
VAFGTLVDTSFRTHDGDVCQIVLDAEGYSGTTYSPRPDGYLITPGDAADHVLTPRISLAGTCRLYVEDATLMQLLRAIPGSDPRDYRLTIKKGGSEQFVGYCVPSATDTPRADNVSDWVTLRAKDRLRGLNDDWTDATGNAFPLGGTRTLAVAVTSILSRLGLGLPLDMVMDWRPESMGAADDPGSVQVPNGAFYRDGGDGTLRPMNAGAVLDDLLTHCNCILVQRTGRWRMHQPAAFASGATVDVWQYDTNGTLTGQTTRPATVDVTAEAWEENSDRVSGEKPVIDSRITYEHGAPNVIDIDGGFEELETGSWSFFVNDGSTEVSLGGVFKEQDIEAQLYGGSHYLEIEGQQTADSAAPLSSFANFADRYAVADLGALSADAENMQLTLRVQGRLTDGQGNPNPTDTPDASRAFWAIGGPAPSGTTFWWVEGQGWTDAGSLGPHGMKNTHLDSDVNEQAYESVTHDIPAPPEGLDLELRVYNAVARPGSSSTDDFILYANWDGLAFERKSDQEAATIYRAYHTARSEGEKLERTVRIGTGPWKGSLGALLDDQGNPAQGWSVLGQSQGISVSMLAAEEALRLRSSAQERMRLRLTRPTAIPLSDRAIEYDGTRYWPLAIEERQTSDTEGGFYEVTCVELKTSLPAAVARTIASGRSETFDAPTRAPDTVGVDRATIVKALGVDPTTIEGASYQIGPFVPGRPAAGETLMQMPLRFPFTVDDVLIHVGTTPNSAVDFSITVGSNATQTVSVSSQTTTATIAETINADELLVVTAPDPADPAMADISIAFTLTPA